jgi:starvation-inducible DNA-binding protein
MTTRHAARNGSGVGIGLEEGERKAVADGLSKVLAETYTLYVKTHNFHWNVTGPMFKTLHEMFEQQYVQLQEAVDELAERIRALGQFVPASFSQFSRLSSIEEETHVPSAEQMLRRLLADHETVVRGCREVFGRAEACSDQGTMDLLVARMKEHEKTAWMLRSTLEGGEYKTGAFH